MSDATTTPKRPLFLSVLCVFTWLFCAWALWQCALNIFTDKPLRDLEDQRAANAEARANLEPDDDGAPMMIAALAGTERAMEESAVHALPLNLISILYQLLNAVAAWLMWRSRRSGFWLFVFAQVAGFIAPFFWLTPTIPAILLFGLVGVFWAGLGVLFALNLKHLR
ncbi:MAG: hypothetical protein KA791_15280 [Flavobacteriales bacterium]|nr:hypothetical protein [Flavobacteriales bacterium]